MGLLVVVLGVSMVFSLMWGLGDWVRGHPEETAGVEALGASIGICLVLGGAFFFSGKTSGQSIGRREALLLVGMSWILGGALCAMPYWLWAYFQGAAADAGPFAHYVNCYFEAISGLTTTGASILTDIEVLPQSILFWRAFTHWIGGLGIVVLFVAVLPTLGVGGKRLFRIEAPGPSHEAVRPKITETARVLWMIYVGMTIVETCLLKLLGMSFFDAFCHTFATLATGGFSTRNASVAAFDSYPIEMVIIVFMFLAGVNFGIYYQLLRGRFKGVWKDPELRVYSLFIILSTIAVTINISNVTFHTTAGQDVSASVANAFRYSLFNVISIQTTTGFGTAEFNVWPFFSKWLLIALMFVGGSAGSTGGGIKVIRIIMAAKIIWSELEKVFRPNVIRTVHVGKTVIDQDMKLATLVYFAIIFLLFVGGTFAIRMVEDHEDCDLVTAATATVATLNNIGPGLAAVSPTSNYTFFNARAKLIMSGLMVLGRLEVYALLVLFVPRFWRSD